MEQAGASEECLRFPRIPSIYPSKPPQDAGSWLSLPETNMAPENGWLENEFPLGGPIFRGELLVSGRVNKGFVVGIPDPKKIISSWW